MSVALCQQSTIKLSGLLAHAVMTTFPNFGPALIVDAV
jgi:hypothetical protein